MRGTPFLLKGFVGGLNTVSAPYELEQDETRECLNVVSTTRGSIRKRYGSTLFTESPPNVELDSMAVAIPGSRYLLISGGGKLYSVSSTGTVVEIGKGFTAGAAWSIFQAPKSTAVASQGPIYLTNGVDKPQYWAGAEAKTEVKEWTGVASAPKATDGAITEGTVTLKSETIGFLGSDVGKVVKFETEVKAKVEGGSAKVAEATIEAVFSPKEVQLSIPEDGWAETKTAIHFTLERSYYSKGAHVPNGKYAIFVGNRVWMTGITEDPSAVWFSEFVDIGEGGAQADPSAWPTTNVVRFDSSDGQPITGIGTVGPYILIFKESKTWVIHNLNTGENRKISDSVGCVAQRSIVPVGAQTFFLTANQGVFSTNGSSLQEMSYKVRPTILAINPKQRQNAAGVEINNHYYLSFASGTSETNNRTLDYDLQLKSWWLHDLAGRQWVQHEPVAPGASSLFLIPSGTKKGVVKAFVEGIYTDSGVNYTGNGSLGAYWFSAWDPFGYYIMRHKLEAPFINKRVRQVYFDGEGKIVPIVFKNFLLSGQEIAGVVGNEPQSEPELPVDFSRTESTFGEGEENFGEGGIFGGEQTVEAARLYSLGVARAISVGFGNNSADPFIVNAYMVAISFRKS
jgi:hypothetical protein